MTKDLQAAGADALELNIYALVTDPTINSDLVENPSPSSRKFVKTWYPVTVKLSLS